METPTIYLTKEEFEKKQQELNDIYGKPTYSEPNATAIVYKGIVYEVKE